MCRVTQTGLNFAPCRPGTAIYFWDSTWCQLTGCVIRCVFGHYCHKVGWRVSSLTTATARIMLKQLLLLCASVCMCKLTSFIACQMTTSSYVTVVLTQVQDSQSIPTTAPSCIWYDTCTLTLSLTLAACIDPCLHFSYKNYTYAAASQQ